MWKYFPILVPAPGFFEFTPKWQGTDRLKVEIFIYSQLVYYGFGESYKDARNP
jgi:hypothetical protein